MSECHSSHREALLFFVKEVVLREADLFGLLVGVRSFPVEKCRFNGWSEKPLDLN